MPITKLYHTWMNKITQLLPQERKHARPKPGLDVGWDVSNMRERHLANSSNFVLDFYPVQQQTVR